MRKKIYITAHHKNISKKSAHNKVTRKLNALLKNKKLLTKILSHAKKLITKLLLLNMNLVC